MALSTDLEKRIVDFTRISDDKVFPAEVRQVPSRFSTDITQESITVAYMDSEDGFVKKSEVLFYDNDTTEEWDWKNDEFKCTYVLPEPATVVSEQSPRGVSPIATKSHKMTVAQ